MEFNMEKKIILAPYAKKLRNGKINPKNYPWFSEVIQKLKKSDPNIHIKQIGSEEETIVCPKVDEFTQGLSMQEIIKEIKECTTFISVDSFLGHLGAYIGKRGIVVFGKSDPNIFGYPQNNNVLKDRKYLRKNQFDIWESEPFDKKAFVDSTSLAKIILTELDDYDPSRD